ncbi:hypothetical protein Nham_2877 [Nitrobacter hamburgensis X14]|uniref:Uncharacterized protein n=1 Tax=Nitrobacter hamburgensis (strain DSM 10229 / NCIMB 13809 / X14) TaxID=323097 RepID=Q1QJF2_NITHX|nr:hypothetical protein Nham_2877 [Nitrobacter hamburgensis X14]
MRHCKILEQPCVRHRRGNANINGLALELFQVWNKPMLAILRHCVSAATVSPPFSLKGGWSWLQAADRFGLTGKTDIRAKWQRALGVARAIHAVVGPSAAIRRALLYRNLRRRRMSRDIHIGREGRAGDDRRRHRGCDA